MHERKTVMLLKRKINRNIRSTERLQGHVAYLKKKKQTALKFKCSSKILNPIITFPQCYSQKYVYLQKKKKKRERERKRERQSVDLRVSN